MIGLAITDIDCLQQNSSNALPDSMYCDFRNFEVNEASDEYEGRSTNEGRWTNEEHELFLEGLRLHGKGWKKIAALIQTRSVIQVRTHAQKYFLKMSKARANGEHFEIFASTTGETSDSKKARVQKPDHFKAVNAEIPFSTSNLTNNIKKHSQLTYHQQRPSSYAEYTPILFDNNNINNQQAILIPPRAAELPLPNSSQLKISVPKPTNPIQPAIYSNLAMDKSTGLTCITPTSVTEIHKVDSYPSLKYLDYAPANNTSQPLKKMRTEACNDNYDLQRNFPSEEQKNSYYNPIINQDMLDFSIHCFDEHMQFSDLKINDATIYTFEKLDKIRKREETDDWQLPGGDLVEFSFDSFLANELDGSELLDVDFPEEFF